MLSKETCCGWSVPPTNDGQNLRMSDSCQNVSFFQQREFVPQSVVLGGVKADYRGHGEGRVGSDPLHHGDLVDGLDPGQVSARDAQDERG